MEINIKITGISNRGNYESEELLLDVIDDCELDQYIIRTANGSSNDLDHKWDNVFHFLTPIQLRKGDKIRILSKSNIVGRYHKREISNENSEFIFYFNSDASIWDKHTGAVIFELQSYNPFFDIKDI
ncbi:hypothetical protein [Chryseobacterium sp. 5_R23647]|uniref:hypothetical protein n=1 Tax=Chryseobacterium sp. 5_R23647 TaxID=2258964 RepID=UPI000E25C305|nr:hypothetical protein [Chryseobacterium sp. 5_R23647]REC40539.1 hypothetical protein DRF69_18190 [Chryseobacterium sp. 5_R23647]